MTFEVLRRLQQRGRCMVCLDVASPPYASWCLNGCVDAVIAARYSISRVQRDLWDMEPNDSFYY